MSAFENLDGPGEKVDGFGDNRQLKSQIGQRNDTVCYVENEVVGALISTRLDVVQTLLIDSALIKDMNFGRK